MGPNRMCHTIAWTLWVGPLVRVSHLGRLGSRVRIYEGVRGASGLWGFFGPQGRALGCGVLGPRDFRILGVVGLSPART